MTKSKDDQIIGLDVNRILEGAEVSDEFRTKAETLFEAALAERIAAETEKLNESFEQRLEEATHQTAEEMEGTIDRYLDTVVQSWLKENRLAVETGIREELATAFMTGIKDLFEQHYVEIPEGKEDVLKTVSQKNEELKTQLDEALTSISEMRAQITEYQRTNVLDELSEDLSEVQREKLETLAETIDFTDAETFARKVKTLKESAFSKTAPESQANTSGKPTDSDTGVSRYVKYL